MSGAIQAAEAAHFDYVLITSEDGRAADRLAFAVFARSRLNGTASIRGFPYKSAAPRKAIPYVRPYLRLAIFFSGWIAEVIAVPQQMILCSNTGQGFHGGFAAKTIAARRMVATTTLTVPPRASRAGDEFRWRERQPLHNAAAC